MVELQQKINAEKENIQQALLNLQSTISRKNKTVIELVAMGTFLHNIYNGMKNILKQTLRHRGVSVPKSSMWHKDLLTFSESHKLLSKQLADDLLEYLAFRHFFVHSYGFNLQEPALVDLVDGIPDVWSRFITDVENSLQATKKTLTFQPNVNAIKPIQDI